MKKIDVKTSEGQIELDNFMFEVQKDFPKTSEDVFLYIRAKTNSQHVGISIASEDQNMSLVLMAIAFQNEHFKKIILDAAHGIENYDLIHSVKVDKKNIN